MAAFKVTADELDGVEATINRADRMRALAAAMLSYCEERTDTPESLRELALLMEDLAEDYQAATCGPIGKLLDRWRTAKKQAEAVHRG